ncbi:hypothetical protein ABBQ38_012020 [Trebouxia sp. C0009 RCD-2024]
MLMDSLMTEISCVMSAIGQSGRNLWCPSRPVQAGGPRRPRRSKQSKQPKSTAASNLKICSDSGAGITVCTNPEVAGSCAASGAGIDAGSCTGSGTKLHA